jgi:hypothetical protein
MSIFKMTPVKVSDERTDGQKQFGKIREWDPHPSRRHLIGGRAKGSHGSAAFPISRSNAEVDKDFTKHPIHEIERL